MESLCLHLWTYLKYLKHLWPNFFEIWYHCGWRMFVMVLIELNLHRCAKVEPAASAMTWRWSLPLLTLFERSPTFPHFDMIVVERHFEDQYTNCVLKHSWVIWKEGSQDRKRFAASDSGICGESVTTKARTNGPIPDKHCCHLMCRRRGASINYRLHLTSTEMNWTSDVTTIIYIRLLTTECLGLIFENCVQSSKAG